MSFDKKTPSPTASVETSLEQTELEEMLYARHAEIESFNDLVPQRGTAVPALFNQFYKFIQNPSTVSVETFKRMIDTDDTVGSGVDFLTTCLAARIGRYQHPSKEITEWVNDRLEEVQGGWLNCVKELLSASWAGFAVQEKVWANTENGFVPVKLAALPPSTIMFEADRTGELTHDGILQYQRNYNPALMASGAGNMFGWSGSFGSSFGGGRPDPYAKMGDLPFPIRAANSYSYLSIRIPIMKCIHYAFDAQGKFGNPYGRSLLRRAYKYYVMKDAFLQMLSVALDRKGTPLTIVYADPNMTLADSSKHVDGQSKKGQRGMGVRADVAAQSAFANIHNDSTIILPGKKGQVFDTDFVPQDSNAEAFMGALDFCNKSIMRALLIPSLVFTSGDGSGSYALGQEHARTFEKICDGIIAGLKQVLRKQLIQDMIAYNFPKSAWVKDGLGDFSSRELTTEERDKEMTVIEKAVNMGAVDLNDINDLNAVREKAGFEHREEIIEQEMPGEFDEQGNPIESGVDENGQPISEQSGDSGQFGGKSGSSEDRGSTSSGAKGARPGEKGRPAEAVNPLEGSEGRDPTRPKAPAQPQRPTGKNTGTNRD